MNKPGSAIFTVRTHWLMLGVAALLVAGAQSAAAQTFGDFETGLDGFFPSDNSSRTSEMMVGTNIVVTYLNTAVVTTTNIATSGTNVLALTQVPSVADGDNFDWSLEVNGLSNATFAAAISNAVTDTNAYYDLFFDATYNPADFPEAGTSNGPTFINHLIAMIVPAAWVNAAGTFGPTGAQLGENFTNTFTMEHSFRIEDFSNMTAANIADASNNVSMLVSMNGNWDTTGVENAATIYYDNFRIVEWDPFLFGFDTDLEGWFANTCAGSVTWGDDEPDVGYKTMRFLKSGAGECAGCSVIMTPGQHAYEVFRNLIRYRDPDDYVLKVDFIIDTSALHPSVTFLRPRLGFSLLTYEEVTVVDTNTMTTNTYFTNVVTDLPAVTLLDQEILVSNLTAGITSVPLEIRLNAFAWPNNYQYDPLSIRMNLGHEIDGAGFPPPVSRVWFDNIAIGDYVPLQPESTVITSITKSPSDTTLTWVSEPNNTNFFGIVSPVYYGIEKSADLEAGVWGPVASNLLTAYPSDRSLTFPSSGPDEEYYRVYGTFSFIIENMLYDFETTNDLADVSIGPSAAGYEFSFTNSTVAATSGSNSLAVTVSAVGGSGNYWLINIGIPSGSVQYLTILDALNDLSNEYNLAVDVIYDSDTLTSNPSWFQIPFAYNSDSGGWQQSSEAANIWIPDLLADTNTQQEVVTFSRPLGDAGWTEHTTTNDFWTVFLGAQGGESASWTNLTVFFDKIRLSTVNYSP